MGVASLSTRPHDLIQLKPGNQLIYSLDTPIPDWIDDSLIKFPFVVVRRQRELPCGTTLSASQLMKLVPVGIRGVERSQRYGAWLQLGSAMNENIIQPEALVRQRSWEHLPFSRQQLPVIQALKQVEPRMNQEFTKWGPTGSTGFELATRLVTIKETSDLDMVLRLNHEYPYKNARDLVNELKKLPVHCDIQVETSYGSFALEEYATNKGRKLLLKTNHGPILVGNPWKVSQLEMQKLKGVE
ncbi:malonate decarboxylase holo-ACP synthase [Carnobacterium gallinarum]|uniref:malonate decarboxylase holo-ACP synthase n=1 Tax=Carnobacterium gallinarum TaxID=2749 RepID=UPI000554C86B|nr:malonate decarboxylase holo-ACP synthase [Carnobacterium gallinarum]